MARKQKKAVVLLSGGLDSATVLYWAKDQGYQPHGLIFSYGQRHLKEIEKAKALARTVKAPFEMVMFRLPWKGSSLLDKSIAVPRFKHARTNDIPSTYVPGRNIIFLSFAVSYAETIGAEAVCIGANAIDYSGYPDCRPAFYNAFRKSIKAGMKSGVKGEAIEILTPLITMTKAQIIECGLSLGVPFDKTWSCYAGGTKPCGVCDSCRLREKGFQEAGCRDPLKTT